MNAFHKRALQYVKNTNGGATVEHFFEDHEPIGDKLWAELLSQGFVTIDGNGRIALTDDGGAALAAKEQPK